MNFYDFFYDDTVYFYFIFQLIYLQKNLKY